MSRAAPEVMELVRRAAAGDDDAFRRLVGSVLPRLRRWALARTGNPDQADEVVQRTLIRAHRGLDRFAGDSRLTSWLYRIMANVAVDVQRSRTARPTVPQAAAGEVPGAATEPDPVRTVHVERLAGVVRELFVTLPPRQREVMELVDHEGLTPKEVAEMLDVQPVTVRASLFKARRAIRERILARYPELTEGYDG